MQTVPRFQPGDLVDVTIRDARGVRVVDATIDIDLGPFQGGSWVTALPIEKAEIKRITPAEWPPRPGDIWADEEHGEWGVLGDVGRNLRVRALDDDRSEWSDVDEWRAYVGPVRLVRRRGWAPPVEVSEPVWGPVLNPNADVPVLPHRQPVDEPVLLEAGEDTDDNVIVEGR